MSDELDKLDDAALSEVFAVEVAGWSFLANEWFAGDFAMDGLPTFATSADAVLPFLNAAGWRGANVVSGADCWIYIGPLLDVYAYAPTLARAACLALIRAKRAEKGTA